MKIFLCKTTSNDLRRYSFSFLNFFLDAKNLIHHPQFVNKISALLTAEERQIYLQTAKISKIKKTFRVAKTTGSTRWLRRARGRLKPDLAAGEKKATSAFAGVAGFGRNRTF